MTTKYSNKNQNCKMYFADWINQLRYVKTGMYCDDNGIYLRKTEKKIFFACWKYKVKFKKKLQVKRDFDDF